MTELARGAVADRPWGRTLGALGLRGLTGQLVVNADGKRYQVAFANGAVVAATSPLASDAGVRVAMTGGLISSTQVADIARRQAAAPQRDEIELIAELLRLAPDQAMRLRRRAVAQKAARTFSVERGEFVVEDQVTLPVVAGSELDVRSVIYFGARQNLSEARLAADLAGFGVWFRLQQSAYADLPQFGFTETERPVLERLREGALLEELDAIGVEPRAVRALVYALVSCNACEVGGPGRAAAAGKRATLPPETTPASARAPASARGRLSTPPSGVPGAARGTERPRKISTPQGQQPLRRPSDSEPPRARTTSAPPRPRSTSAPPDRAAIEQLIQQRLGVLARHADHYQLLGIGMDASHDDVRKAYFALARQLHPDRLAALGIADAQRDAQRLFAQVNAAFAVLSDRQRRLDYTSILRRGGEAAVRKEQAQAEALAARIVEAEDAFTRGEQLLRREQIGAAIADLARAVELNPEEADYHATLAWAQFCAAPDKAAVAGPTRSALDHAIQRSPAAVTARFYLGRVERMLGRDHEALRHFQTVLQSEPYHAEAAGEARMIEQRLASGGGPEKSGGGLFRRR